MSSSSIQQAGDCGDSSVLLLVNYCPVQREVQPKGQDSFRNMKGRKRMIWVGVGWGRREKNVESGRERI